MDTGDWWAAVCGVTRVRHNWMTEHTRTPLPPQGTASYIVNIFLQSSAFVTTDEPTLTHHYYLEGSLLVLCIVWVWTDVQLTLHNVSLKCVGPLMCRYFSTTKTMLLLLNCFRRIQLFATLWTVACQPPLSMAFSRQEYWSGLPFPPPGINTIILHHTWLVEPFHGWKSRYREPKSQL